ncbi:hypothetical protein [Hymenobacter perfusus]|uniref:Uncharacterized protein n=1 Tax=Hymenobacter perfusus TaxID=1236770 RepID=A0A428KEK0_9BACT|nr:hypothetical protein [Hymenobacter perfusus]RSK44794.1 hypothetical protein EI293_09825 [Hymenobacter perfusus]
MDTAATLAFFQNFYTGSALYVVPEPGAVAPEASAVAAATHPAGNLPLAVPVPANTQPLLTPRPVAPQPPVAPAAAPAPLAPARPAVPVSAPVVPPVAAAAPAPLPPAPKAVASVPPAPVQAVSTPVQPLGTLPLAQLPAAAPAPAGRVQPTPTQSPVAHIPFATLGSNAQGLVILVRVSPEQFRKLPRNVFLNNLLKALRLVMEDVVLVNVEHEKFPVALCSLRQHLAARQFLAFGKNLLDVAVYTTQPYEPVLLYGDTAFLGASEIEMLEYDAGRKKQLWQSVQRMFLG